jgi:beta-lactamase class D
MLKKIITRIKKLFKKKPKEYIQNTTIREKRIYKGQYAPQGSVWFVVTVNTDKKRYDFATHINMRETTMLREQIHRHLIKEAKDKLKLKGIQ